MDASKKKAAVSYVCGLDGLWRPRAGEISVGRILVVWNRRYGGWTLPGGLVEEGETLEAAQARELYEETGCVTIASEPIYSAPTELVVESHRGSAVHVFRVMTRGEPRQREPGCPVTYFTREEFLKWCPFRAFYERMFELVPGL